MDIVELAARIQALEDVEAVKKAMYRYWRCLDDKLFDEFGDCFTEDVTADYGMPGWTATGRQALVGFLQENENPTYVKLSHAGHNAEIDLIDEGHAHGYFKLHDWVTMGGRTVMRGFGKYDMTFAKDDGVWRIKVMNLHYAYREEHNVWIDNQMVEITAALRASSDPASPR